jgi:hypothetical protein
VFFAITVTGGRREIDRNKRVLNLPISIYGGG